MQVELYALLHPLTKEVRYIGKANNSQKRLKSHLSSAKTKKTPIYNWINSLLIRGLRPELIILKTVSLENWQQEEINLIADYKDKGAILLNVAIGGNQPFCSQEVRAANGAKTAKAIHSDPKRKRLWKLKQLLACNIRYLKKAGKIESVNRITELLNSRGIHIG